MAKGKPSGRYTINGTRGDDNIDGSTYDLSIQFQGLIINGSAGNDILRGGAGADQLNGGDGNDRLFASNSDLVDPAVRVLIYSGGKGIDTLDVSGLAYDEGKGVWIQSTGSGDGYIGTNVVLNEYYFNRFTWDVRYFDSFSSIENWVFGDGNDLLQLLTPSPNATVWAGAGNDQIAGGSGNDVLYGEAGNDVLAGSWGNDILIGGEGNDRFMLGGRVTGAYTYDVIKDFEIKSDEFDTSFDTFLYYPGHSFVWTQSDSGPLHARIFDNGEAIGEIVFENLTYADLSNMVFELYDSSIYRTV